MRYVFEWAQKITNDDRNPETVKKARKEIPSPNMYNVPDMAVQVHYLS